MLLQTIELAVGNWVKATPASASGLAATACRDDRLSCGCWCRSTAGHAQYARRAVPGPYGADPASSSAARTGRRGGANRAPAFPLHLGRLRPGRRVRLSAPYDGRAATQREYWREREFERFAW